MSFTSTYPALAMRIQSISSSGKLVLKFNYTLQLFNELSDPKLVNDTIFDIFIEQIKDKKEGLRPKNKTEQDFKVNEVNDY